MWVYVCISYWVIFSVGFGGRECFVIYDYVFLCWCCCLFSLFPVVHVFCLSLAIFLCFLFMPAELWWQRQKRDRQNMFLVSVCLSCYGKQSTMMCFYSCDYDNNNGLIVCFSNSFRLKWHSVTKSEACWGRVLLRATKHLFHPCLITFAACLQASFSLEVLLTFFV